MELSRETRIATAYDRAMREAKIEQPALVGRTLTIRIDGIEYAKRVRSMTTAGLKAACVDALAEHCAIRAAATVALELGVVS